MWISFISIQLINRMKGPNSTKWIVAWICCFMSFLLLGAARLSGLLFVAVMDQYGVSRSEASLPFVLCYTVRNIAGPLIGYLGRRLGLQKICIIGCALSAIGIGSCFFAENVITVTILWGGMFGFGLGLSTVLIPEILRQHFNRNIARANGIAFGGECLAGFVLPVVFEASLITYGAQGTFLILSGLVLNSIPAAMLLKKPGRIPISSSSYEEQVPNESHSKDICVSEEQGEKALKVHSSSNTFCSKILLYEDSSDCLMKNKGDAEDEFAKFLRKKENRDAFHLDIDIHSIVDDNNDSNVDHNNEMKQNLTANLNRKLVLEDYTSKDQDEFKEDIQLSNKQLLDSVQCSQKCAEDINIKSNNTFLTEGYIYAQHHRTEISSSICKESLITQKAHVENSALNLAKSNKYGLLKGSYSWRKSEKSYLQRQHCPVTAESHPEDITVHDILPKNNKNSTLHAFSVFFDGPFILMLLTQSAFIYIVTTVLTVVVDFSKDIGVKSQDQIYIVMGMSIADMIGRFSLGFVTDSGFITNTTFISFGFAIMGILLYASVWLTGFILLMIVMFLFGLLIGGLLIMFPGIVSQYVEEDKVTMALASRFTLYGPLSLTQSSLIGFFRSNLESYDGVFYILSAACVTCSVLTVLTPLVAKRRNARQHLDVLNTYTDSILAR